jgi:hypothetical protein
MSKRALEILLKKGKRDPSPYDIGRDIFERYGKVKPTEDLARHSKRLLRKGLAGKGR